MDPIILAFWGGLAATLVALAVTVWAGVTRRRRAHIGAAVGSVLVLVVTIILARMMGKLRAFPPAEMRIHLSFAISSTVCLVPVIATGAMLLRRPRWRIAHRCAISLFLILAVSAVGTGIWVFTLSTPN